MGYLIGTDEAGYGPSLGPLVISATVWEAPDGVSGEDLFGRLSHVIASRPDVGGTRRVPVADGDGRAVALPVGTRSVPDTLVFADSKTLYSPERGLRHLERGLWAALGALGFRPESWRDVWRAIAPEALDEMQSVPWYADYDGPAPLDCDGEDLSLLAEPLRAGLAAAGVRLVAVRSRAIFAHQFNDLVDRHGSKGAALSHQTLDLAARMIESLPPGPVSVICDKHGGRNRYGGLLAEHFPEQFIEIRGEGRQRSSYRFGPAERRVEFCFRVGAESSLPAALASMASKYLRELAMRAFNDFWRRHVHDLQPTAGYPQDAKRFRADIGEAMQSLHISDRMLWRVR
jgi:ribonuclease HII